MFLTPIFYPEETIPAAARRILHLNPFAYLVGLYRNAFMTGQLPSATSLIIMSLFCLLMFLLGYFWFSLTKKGFADVL
jgi:ABC-type polysaccharide/polyol phosphate export permease